MPKIYEDETIVIAVGGGGGGDSTQHTVTREQVGPASYAAGGFVVDLAVAFSSLNWLDLVVKKNARGVLPACDAHVTLNSPSAGKATVKLLKKRHDRVSSVGNVQNQPGGVTIATVSGQTTTTEGAHTHQSTHDHSLFASGANTTGGGAVGLGAVGPNQSAHTHNLDLASITVTTTAPLAVHSHADNSIYAHGHAPTHVGTALAWVEITAGTDLSGTTWYLAACGQSV